MASSQAILTASRERKLLRRQAIDPSVGFPIVAVTTASTVVMPSEHQQELRKTVIRHALRFPHLLADANSNDWDVVATTSAIREIDLIQRSSPNDPGVLAFLRWCQCQPANTVGGPRLHALDAFRARLGRVLPSGHSVDASDSLLLAFLQRCGWLIDKSVKLWQERPYTLDEIVDYNSALSTPGPSTGQKCERLAAFITITPTDSDHSAARFLEMHDFIYIDSVNAWSEEGKLPLILSTGPSRGLREIIASDHPFYIQHGQNKPTDPTVAVPNAAEAVPSRAAHLAEVQIEEEAPSQEVQEMYRYLEVEHPRGWIIDMDNEHPVLGIRDAQKLRIEYIHNKLENRCIWATGRKSKSYELDGDVTDDESEDQEFDFDNNKKVIRLTAFRNEWRLKLGEALKKPAAIKFLPVERDWIYEQIQGHVEAV
jgi:hypothetical protein